MNVTMPIRTNMDFTFMWGTYDYTSRCSGTERRVCMYICRTDYEDTNRESRKMHAMFGEVDSRDGFSVTGIHAISARQLRARLVCEADCDVMHS